MLESYELPDDEFYDEIGERIWSDDDPLVRRLRAMTWAEVPVEVRERCWAQIEQRIEELDRKGLLPTSPAVRDVNLERYEFSRGASPCRTEARRGVTTSPASAFRPRGLAATR